MNPTQATNQVTVTANNDWLNKPVKDLYNMGNVNIGGTPTIPTPPKTNVPTADQNLAAFNQSMVKPIAPNVAPTNPSVDSTLKTDISGLLNTRAAEDIAYETYLKQQADITVPTEEEARQQALRNMQAEIDATNTLYADKLRRAQIQGQGLIGQTGAIQARRGLLGSDFGAAQTQNVNRSNEEVYSDIENEKLVKINQIQTKAKQDATAEMEAKRLAKMEGSKAYVEWMRENKTMREKNLDNSIQTMLANGTSYTEFTEKALKDMAESYGVTTDQIKAKYNQAKASQTAEANKLAAEEAKAGRMTLTEGQRVYQIDPVTGEYKQVAYNPKTYKATLPSNNQNYNTNIPSTGNQETSTILQKAQPWLAQYNSGAMDLNDIYTKIGSSKEAQPIKNELARLIAAQGGKRVIPMDDAQISAINDQIKNIDDLLKDGGYNYKVISGPIQGGLFGFGGRITGAKGDALAIARNLVSNQTLQALADAKAKGITFGALSEAELNAVANSASRIASKIIKDGENIVGFEGTEDEFKKDLEAVRDGLIKAKTKKTGGTGTQTPEQDNANYTNLLNTNKDQVIKNEEIFKSQYGRYPENATEYFQVFPEDNRQSFNNVVGDTNLSQGVVSGVNITSYATDPLHEQKIASIVQKIPDPDTFNYDAYIRSIAPTSRITGDMIKTASSTYDVDPRLVLAIIQNDSRFGTLGHGATNNNPGNIGQFDNLKTTAKGYPTLAAGVEAVAQWLSRHKTNNLA